VTAAAAQVSDQAANNSSCELTIANSGFALPRCDLGHRLTELYLFWRSGARSATRRTRNGWRKCRLKSGQRVLDMREDFRVITTDALREYLTSLVGLLGSASASTQQNLHLIGGVLAC
jgi:hypothetical protein